MKSCSQRRDTRNSLAASSIVNSNADDADGRAPSVPGAGGGREGLLSAVIVVFR
jgi:hypothetical protein